MTQPFKSSGQFVKEQQRIIGIMDWATINEGVGYFILQNIVRISSKQGSSMANRTTLIPIEMCFETLKKKEVRTTQLYIFLKFQCSGKLRIEPEVFRQVAKELGLKSEKTVKAQLKNLEEKSWICYSLQSGYHFVKGYDSISRMEGYQLRTSVEFDLRDIKKFKGFLVAAVITYLIKKQKARNRAVELKRRNSKTSALVRAEYFPIANEALAKILGVAISTAYEWKKLAERQGYIKIRKNFALLESLEPQFLNDFKKYGEIPAGKLSIKNGCVSELMPDEIASHIFLRKRRKVC